MVESVGDAYLAVAGVGISEKREQHVERVAITARNLTSPLYGESIQRPSPPYSPDLAPMDFRVFPEVKSQLRGIRFASKQELTVAAKRIVSSFDADWYRDTFDKWISRHIQCIRVGGDYVEKI
ncbi:histone-lysine N-methyltransferase SETMAR-like isoform X2 [Dreissena polymorpha]|uniref:histone-lysine N-methyltransferase SETMAR-like isoform X2 n=1 Tax=Dreissena polymorpha TaxID=45954 RepID=UPI002263D766|nr:histone-lysine N-methyltransferase SETMAR-like isoform X2 [Dreissena polymorpha]